MFAAAQSFKKPTQEVVDVMAAVMVLLAAPGAVPKDRTWTAAQKMIGNVDQFLRTLQVGSVAFVSKGFRSWLL